MAATQKCAARSLPLDRGRSPVYGFGQRNGDLSRRQERYAGVDPALDGNFGASLLACGNTVFAFDDSGATTLFAAEHVYKNLGRNELTGKVQATPAVSEGCLFVRTDQRLIKVGS